MSDQPEQLLGKTVVYPRHYDPDVLQGIERARARKLIGIDAARPGFVGADEWTCYEMSWLDQSGKPYVGVGEITVPCESPRLVESKSFKLYLNSLNERRFTSSAELHTTLADDLHRICGAPVVVKILSIDEYTQQGLHGLTGVCLDDLALPDPRREPNAEPDHGLLSISDKSEVKEESLYSHLLKSNCPVTGQPDWASVQISYRGRAVNHQSLLAYIVSFRHHQAFHEQCVEKIFYDINRQCKPETLTVVARYTRRGGIDINPWRSTELELPDTLRTGRQ